MRRNMFRVVVTLTHVSCDNMVTDSVFPFFFFLSVCAEWRSHQHLRGELSGEDHNPGGTHHLHFQSLLYDH